MKKVQFGLMVLGMLAVGQINAQTEGREKPAPTVKPAPGTNPKVDKQFAKLDANSDGFLVLEEMQKGQGEEAKDQENRFRKMDVNKDNRVSPEEFRAQKSKKAKKPKKEKVEKDDDDKDEKSDDDKENKIKNKGGKK